MKIKALALTVTLVVTFGLLAGCNSNTPAEKEEGTDVVTTASIVDNEGALEKAIGTEGTWIVAVLNDVKTDKELVIEGEFRDKGDAANDLYRKLALYAQDEDHNVTERYTLTAPKLTIKSPNTKIQGGTFVGDVYVEAEGFTVTDATIEGNVYFSTEEVKSTFAIENEGKVTGTIAVAGADVVTTASLINNDVALEKAVGSEGTWIIAALNNISTKKELVIEGEFRDKNDAANDLYRKLALYAQDADHNVTARYTLSAPKLTIKSPNTKIQGGTFVGDIYVEADGFTVTDATIEGNVYFATEENKSTFITENEGKVTGTTEVK